MAVVKLKESSASKVRTVNLKRTEGVLSTIEVGDGHIVISDEPVERGGTDKATSPLMYFTTSLAACQTVQIVKVAEAMRFNHGTINIECSTTTDRLPGVEEGKTVMRFCAAEMIIEIETDEPEKKIERLKTISEDQCPVGNLFSDAGYEPVITWNILPMPS